MSTNTSGTGHAVQFLLPRFHSGANSSGLFSFRKQSLTVLGIYSPGYFPVIFDPITLKNDTPNATLVHERAHQNLTINTSAGLFHQCLEAFAEHSSLVREAYLISAEEQWSVQELVATYVEMIVVAQEYPQCLESSISCLPYDPPYRQVYASVARYLPICVPYDRETILAYGNLVESMTAWSMSNDSLIAFRDPRTLTVPAYRSYLKRQSPHCRFERLMSRLLSTADDFRGLLETLVLEQKSLKPDPLRFLFSRFSSLMGEPAEIEIAAITQNSHLLIDAWRAAGYEPRKRRVAADFHEGPGAPLPAILPSGDFGHRFEAKAILTATSLREQLASPWPNDVGLIVGFATDGHSSRIHFGTYIRDGKGPWPIYGACREDFKPIDLLGVLPPKQVYEVLRDAPSLLDIFIFRGVESWVWWKEIENGEIRNGTILVCSERLYLSIERVRAILKFQGIGQGACGLILQSAESPVHWGFILNAKMPNVFAMIQLKTDAGIRLFNEISTFLGLESAGEIERPQFDLMRMLTEFETYRS
jgi:hypothetical protein